MAHPYAKYMQGGERAKAVARGYAKGGAVVNIKIEKGEPPAPPPALPPILPPAPPGPPPGPVAGPPGGMPPPGMKKGGRVEKARGGKVKMEAGAYSGEGRLEKIKAYGKRARSG